MYKNVELRKLPAGSLCTIATILETNEDWKKVISCIPKDPQSPHFEAKYNQDHIRLIEEYSKCSGRTCSEILFDEWGTSGRVRPTLTTLKDVVSHAQIYRAADEIASILGEALPERPTNGPAASIDTSITKLLAEQSMEQRFHDLDSIEKKVPNQTTSNNDFNNITTAQMKTETNVSAHNMFVADIPNLSGLSFDFNTESQSGLSHAPTHATEMTNISNSEMPHTYNYQTTLPNIGISLNSISIENTVLDDERLEHFDYETLKQISFNFSQSLLKDGDKVVGKIGSGGFGEVFVGNHPQHGILAIKKAHSSLTNGDEEMKNRTIRMWNSEIRYLSEFRHKNIVKILGFSHDGPTICIVCEYIEGGSLLDRLEEKVLSEKQRVDIMLGTADGLKYLHTSEHQNNSTHSIESTDSNRKNFVHGDVKSANILLTKDFVPKLCDFGVATQYDTTHVSFSFNGGTDAYMAPEGFSGTITQKADIFSYGVVLLELLTGLKTNIKNGFERIHIKEFIEEKCPDGNLAPVLDPAVKEWTKHNEIYHLAKKCMAFDRRNRPIISEVCDVISDW